VCAGRARVIAVFALGALLPAAVCGQSPAPPPISARGTVQVAFTPWDDAERMVLESIAGAKRQILVQAFSFTSRNIAGALIAAHRRGVEVRITADREQAFSRDSSRIPDLAGAGIAVLLEVRYQSAHNKVMIIDAGSADAAVVTGSYNWTYAARNRNAENVIIFRQNEELAQRYALNWQRHAQDALPYDALRQ
jgi:phosphatidylserine/phosphatidylglycerophosphate/cardiolipin synthase-like enzyme